MRALFVSAKSTSQSPRILKQISWISKRKWTYDLLEVGGAERSDPLMGFQRIAKVRPFYQRYFAYLFMGIPIRHQYLNRQLLDSLEEISLDNYRLVVVNDLIALPKLREMLEACEVKPTVMIDFHENYTAKLGRNALERIVFDPGREWLLEQCAAFIRDRSNPIILTCASHRDKEIYEKRFNQSVHTILNSSAYEELAPSEVDSSNIRLVHHGVATRGRGQEVMLLALSRLDSKFNLTFFLVGPEMRIGFLRILAVLLRVGKRVTFRKAVPPLELPKTLNAYDVAIVLIPPVTENQAHSLPGKFFESIQARLAIITGPNPEMGAVLKRYRSGRVLTDWSHRSLAIALKALTHCEITTLKQNQIIAARELNALRDEERFEIAMREQFPFFGRT